MGATEEFIKRFYVLEGITLGERCKNFNKILSDLIARNPTEQDLIRLDSSLKPRDALGEALKLDIFIALKCTNYLFKVLQGENSNLRNRLLKHKHFFKESFSHLNANNLLDLLRNVSPLTRKKIIWKLGKNLRNEQLSEDYYKAIKECYGLHTASGLLIGCNPGFVIKEYELFWFKLKSRHILKLVRFDVKFATSYFNELFKIPDDNNYLAKGYTLVFRYLAANDCEQFLSLLDKYELQLKLNSHLTRKLYEFKKEDVIAKPNKYLQIMHLKTLKRLLKDDFPKFYENSFPRSINEFANTIEFGCNGTFSTYSQTYCLIHHLSDDEKYKMLTKAFKNVYKVDIFNYPNFINDAFIETMPCDERLKWAKQRLGKDRWMCYLDIKESISMIKDRIMLFSDRVTRIRYLKYLIETCRIHNDKESLLEVLKYFFERHRNEENQSRETFLKKLLRSFKLEELSDDHWSIILKLMKLFEIQDYSFFEMCDISEKYLLRLYQTNRITDEAVFNHLKCLITNYCYLRLFEKHLDYRKDFCLRIPNMMCDKFQGTELHLACRYYLEGLHEWNKCRPNDKISISSFSQILKVFGEMLSKSECDYDFHLLVPHLYKDINATDREMLLNAFWSNFDNNHHCAFAEDIIKQILKHDPLALMDKVDILCKGRLRGQFVLERIKFYHHIGLPQKFKEHFIEQLNDDAHRIKAINCLVHFTSTEEYVQLMTQYRLKEVKMDYETVSLVKYQCAFITGLKYTNVYSLIIPIVKEFCAGDYLKFTIGTLYRIFNYSPINITQDLLMELFDRAVSVRKHAIFLTTETRDSLTIYNMLKEQGAKENNPSLIKFILKRTFKYFCSNPSDEFFELLKRNSQYIKRDDEEAYEYLYQGSKVPSPYLPKFVQLAWERISESEVDTIKEKRFQLLEQLNDDIIQHLPDSFCRNLLENYLYSKDKSTVREFACKYILVGDGYENLRFVCNLLKEHIKLDWKTNDDHSKKKIIHSVLVHICNSMRQNNRLEHLKMFADVWHDSLNPVNAYEEYLILNFNIMYLIANVEYKLRNYAETVYQFYTENIAKYGNMIVDIFAKVLSSTIDAIMEDDEYKENRELKLFNFYVGLFNTNKSAYNFALILNLLPKEYSMLYDIKSQHQMILNEINRSDEIWLKIRYLDYCKHL